VRTFSETVFGAIFLFPQCHQRVQTLISTLVSQACEFVDRSHILLHLDLQSKTPGVAARAKAWGKVAKENHKKAIRDMIVLLLRVCCLFKNSSTN
jgi:hypothetical protein